STSQRPSSLPPSPYTTLFRSTVYQAALDNAASEQSARMVAMRNATDNATELIEDYTLAANKARQGRITKEMLEIASGAEALSKRSEEHTLNSSHQIISYAVFC